MIVVEEPVSKLKLKFFKSCKFHYSKVNNVFVLQYNRNVFYPSLEIHQCVVFAVIDPYLGPNIVRIMLACQFIQVYSFCIQVIYIFITYCNTM